MLILRYLSREISVTFFAVILVALLAAISNKFVSLIAKAASGNIPPDLLFQIILFQVPELLAFLLPIAFFLAILLSFGRCFADNEIPVMLACGISWQRLLLLTIGLSFFIMIITGALTCYIAPKVTQYRERLLATEGPLLLVQTVMPGRFHSFQKDRLVFYVEALSTDRTQLKDLFIAEQPKGEARWSFITARRGKMMTDQENGLMYIKLESGTRYNGTPGQKDYNILHFEAYQRLIEGPMIPEGVFFHRTMPMQMLLQQPTASNRAELQWRLSLPLSVPLLALIAVPLSRVSPRKGRFGRLFIGIVICIIYYNLLTISKRWVVTGILPPSVGVWWVHILLFLTGLFFLARTTGRWNQWRYFILKPCQH